jgi:hypothetical protein
VSGSLVSQAISATTRASLIGSMVLAMSVAPRGSNILYSQRLHTLICINSKSGLERDYTS